ncbi:dihydropteroate synthase [Prosthecomicrobium pneumaticum]|uniref:Dihydropteroate synthase n=1 Tax=Prosthecomicrobium pneumaticum TaxID=81895 RepID=A0A7W9L359_9HYPH|nr:dihydropteroate synthase [Prosthecomicrobium pneumaticum]MBB5754206.1 dihydropteroate synthase [Prosthecomicrobium pneumaticum]
MLDQFHRRATGRTLVMGVVNVTPDSFSDGGDFADAEAAIAHGVALAAEGADILDVGGESTRPGATEVDAETECRRILPVIAGLARRTAVTLSVDTYKAAVAEAALAAGARIINDVWGLQREPEIAPIAAAHGAAVVASHWEREARTPATILDAVLRFFERSLAIARRAGVPDDRIVLDPGLGFNKTGAENLALLAHLDRIVALGFPVLVGASRKRFIGELTGKPPKERTMGSVGAHVVAATKGASIVRVHDVAAHRQALSVADAVLAAQEHR